MFLSQILASSVFVLKSLNKDRGRHEVGVKVHHHEDEVHERPYLDFRVPRSAAKPPNGLLNASFGFLGAIGEAAGLGLF